MRRAALCLGLVLGWTLACSGGSPDPSKPRPKPTPEQPAGPQPAPNSQKCANVGGVSLPLDGGTIIECQPGKKVVIDHEDPKARRWEYAGAFKKKGWSQGDPVNNNPSVRKGGDLVVFEASASRVILVLQMGGP